MEVIENQKFMERVNNIDPKLFDEKQMKFDSLSEIDKQGLKNALSWLLMTDKIKNKARESIQKEMKTNDIIAIVLAIFGVATSLIASSLYIDFVMHDVIKDAVTGVEKITIEVKAHSNDAVKVLRWLTSISTLALIIFIIRHYQIRLKFQIRKNQCSPNSTLCCSNLIGYLIFEVLFCLMHTPPYFDGFEIPFTQSNGVVSKVDVDLILTSLIPSRVYLLMKYYSFYSSWGDDKAEKICIECNTLGGISFAIKAKLKENPYLVVGVLMFFSIMIFGYSLRNVEVAFMQDKETKKFQDWRHVWNGFWCITTTIFTVGYGDYYPQTILGKGIAVVACVWGTFLISLMVLSLTLSVEFTHQEEKAYNEIKKKEMYEELERRAVRIFKAYVNAVRYRELNLGSMNLPKHQKEYFDLNEKLKLRISEFSDHRQFVLTKEQQIPIENLLHKLNDDLVKQMDYLVKTSNLQVKIINENIKFAKELQDQVFDEYNRMKKMTKILHESAVSQMNRNENDKESDSNISSSLSYINKEDEVENSKSVFGYV